jgi:hypothetical protein
MPIKSQLFPVNLLSHDDDPNWKVVRFPFVDAAPEVLAKMLPGYLVKFDATLTHVLPALAADDALLSGVIIDLPDQVSNPGDVTVAVALSGSFNQRQIHYANAWSQAGSPTPLSPAAIARLRDMNIYLDPSVPTGAFSP